MTDTTKCPVYAGNRFRICDMDHLSEPSLKPAGVGTDDVIDERKWCCGAPAASVCACLTTINFNGDAVSRSGLESCFSSRHRLPATTNARFFRWCAQFAFGASGFGFRAFDPPARSPAAAVARWSPRQKVKKRARTASNGGHPEVITWSMPRDARGVPGRRRLSACIPASWRRRQQTNSASGGRRRATTAAASAADSDSCSPMETGSHGPPHISRLYPEILALIFSYLDVRDKGRVSQVCSAWREAAYHKSVWRGVEAKLHLRRPNPSLFPSLVRRGIRRVQVLSLKRSLRDVIQGVPNLESLNMIGCFNLTDAWLNHAFVQDMHSLSELNLSMCKQITDNSLGRIAQHLKGLERLDLGGCTDVTNTGLLLIAWGLHNLRSLNLRSCRGVSDPGIGHLAGMSPTNAIGTLRLESLCLQDCQKLTDDALRYISNGLHDLRSLNLSFCASVTDAGLKHAARMARLRELNLRSCDNISDLGLAYLAEGGSRISTLDVSFCDKVGDQGLLHASQGLFQLRSLSLNACPVSDDGIGRVARSLGDLQTLHLGQCGRVTDKGLSLIADHLKQLRCIDLYGCTKITTVGLEKLMQLPNLGVLNLGLWQHQLHQQQSPPQQRHIR
ncbi:F-box/LRR-repeat protein 14 [Rhipicephalus sanguineus]|uniref:F-box domain-containing protein n=1 Tax=Rhipicephalus sanguineus TaxID=34632 RepID=A0A9D4PQ82_RHISA|nr:F-box/LRR-repeat protein 14 [Rhipicephalus sanguineus]KAH7948545.1 hypothetical protein HPB52_024109 [Rhipicephalus sanguineus]